MHPQPARTREGAPVDRQAQWQHHTECRCCQREASTRAQASVVVQDSADERCRGVAEGVRQREDAQRALPLPLARVRKAVIHQAAQHGRTEAGARGASSEADDGQVVWVAPHQDVGRERYGADGHAEPVADSGEDFRHDHPR